MQRPSSTLHPPLLLLPLTVFLALLIGQAGPASACSGSGCYCETESCQAWYPCSQECPCIIENATGVVESVLGETTITPVGGRRAVIETSGFMSLGMDSGDECALAIGEIDGIEEIRSIRVLDESGALLRELPFAHNAASGASFRAEAAAHGLAPSGDAWQGFYVEVLGEIPAGELFSIVLDAKLEQGVSLGLLADQVRTSGLIGTGAANSDGTIDAGHHAHFRPLGDTPVSLLPKATRAARPEIEPKH